MKPMNYPAPHDGNRAKRDYSFGGECVSNLEQISSAFNHKNAQRLSDLITRQFPILSRHWPQFEEASR